MDLTDMYKRIHQTSAEYIFFSSALGVFSRIEYIFRDKISHSKCKIEIIPSIFSNFYGMKLEINNRKKTKKMTNVCVN